MTTARRYVILSFQVDSKYCLDMQLERHFPGNIPLNWYQARDTSLREMRVSGSREDFWTHLPEEAIYKALDPSSPRESDESNLHSRPSGAITYGHFSLLRLVELINMGFRTPRLVVRLSHR